MKTCVKCGKKGPFLWLSKNGYCEECAREIKAERERKGSDANPLQADTSIPPIPEPPIQQVEPPQKSNSPIYRRAWFWIAAILLATILVNGLIRSLQAPLTSTYDDLIDTFGIVGYIADADNLVAYSITKDPDMEFRDGVKKNIATALMNEYGADQYPNIKQITVIILSDSDAIVTAWNYNFNDQLLDIDEDFAKAAIILATDQPLSTTAPATYDTKNDEPDGPDILTGEVESVSGAGSGDIVITTTSASDHQLCKINFTHDGEHNFIVREVGSDPDYLINKIGPWDGWYLFAPGEHSYEITADGDWTYAVLTIDKGSRSGASGRNDSVSDWFDAVGPSTVTFSYFGEHNFIVRLLCVDTGEEDYLVNKIGQYNGQKYVEFDPSLRYVWIVAADDVWSIEIEQ